MNTKAWGVLTRVAVTLAVAFSLVTLCIFFFEGVKLVASDICETRGQEPLIVSGILKIISGSPLYTHPNAPPFDVMQYSPLYYYAAAAAASGGEFGPEYVTRAGRVLSILFSVLHLAVFSIILVRLLRVPIWLASIAGSLVYVLHAPWDFLARPDALVSLLYISAIGLAIWAVDEQRNPTQQTIALLAGSLLGFTAFMTKQNGAQIVIVLFIFLLSQRDWRRALFVASLPAFLLGASLLVGPKLFGESYVENAVGGLNNGIRPYAAFVATYIPVFLEFNVAALSAVAAYFVTGWMAETCSSQKRFLAIATIVTFVLAALSATKLGSAPNHYNDLITLLLVVIAYGIHTACKNDPYREISMKWAVSIFVFIFLSNQLVLFGENFSNISWRRFSAYHNVVDHMRKALEAEPDATIFTVDYTFANFFPGKVVIPQYTLSGIMFARGLVDYSSVQQMMDSGQVRWILAGTEQDIVRQLGFVGIKPNRYTRTTEIDGFAIWTFDPAGSSKAKP